ncbi:conserved hypothetical protein [Sporisorium reilianum SRZ2]|uniref:Multiple myeloma tumor-associated protein 2-like N-terminal domain-containing protein n=1 Tax=Sporisorium reilianum (strain SRZ2) TaxID=999809 RepID=E6ZJI5_SPORE|nr:conserved hypothetical protein [Sporisorium reilianum SRZ2]
MYHPTRGGARGGAAEFSWDKVKQSKDREFYLGNSVAAPTGRWQDGRDINWYNKDKDASSSAADERREELRRIKEAENEALYAKLGRAPPVGAAGEGAGAVVGERLASGSSARVGTGANSAPLDAGRGRWGAGEEVSEADKRLARKFAREEVRRRRAEAGEDHGRSEDGDRRRRSSRRHDDAAEEDRHRSHHSHRSSRHKDEDHDDKESRRHRHHRDTKHSRSRSRSPDSSGRHRRRHHDEDRDRHRSRGSPSRREREESRRHESSSHRQRDRDDDHEPRSRSHRDR